MEAVREVIDTYTFFDDAYDKVNEWSGKKGELQRLIVDEYTEIIPTLMREVSLFFILNNIHHYVKLKLESLKLKI